MKMQSVAVKAVFLMALCTPGVALAYLDPGSGSLLLQGLIALAGGVVATVGVYWRATLGLFNRLFRKRHNTDQKLGPDAP